MDPTKDEMVEFLKLQGCDDEFDREEAIWWFSNLWHSGQWSNLYSALSISEYKPGVITRCPRDNFWFDALVLAYIPYEEL